MPSRRPLLVLLVLAALSLGAGRDAAAACPSTCTRELAACKQACPAGGSARHDCRVECARQSACTAPGARIGTLAYVVTECSAFGPGAESSSERLVIRRGNCDPTTVLEFPLKLPSVDCLVYGLEQIGDNLMGVGVLQRLAVLPGGSGVVFEVTNDFSLRPASTPEPPEKGIFFVRADGTELRRLASSSRVAPFLSADGALSSFTDPLFSVSPDGKTIGFSDLGPGSDGQQARQIVTLDVGTGRRTQLTHLPATPGAVTCCPTFLDNRRLSFSRRLYPDESFLGGAFTHSSLTVRANGSRLKEVQTTVTPGGGVVPIFGITGKRKSAVSVSLPRTPRDHFPIFDELPRPTTEAFLVDGKNILQLTNFDRSDTTPAGRGAVVFGQRVFFIASADPFGTNPGENCQMFSINTLGIDLRQLTQLRDPRPSIGCFRFSNVFGYHIERYSVNRLTGTIGFAATCDPVGRNPLGSQAFSMRPDGSGLRQLTSLRGMETAPDGTVHVELLGPASFQ